MKTKRVICESIFGFLTMASMIIFAVTLVITAWSEMPITLFRIGVTVCMVGIIGNMISEPFLE